MILEKKGFILNRHKIMILGIGIDLLKVSRIKKICSRCGKGVFMSEHKDRRTCGQCNNTEFI